MTDQVAVADATASQQVEDTAPETEVSEVAGTKPADAEATWRNRLNGQTAATNKAIAERDAAMKRLEAFEAKEREAQMAGLSEVERLKAEKADAERRAQEAETKAEGKLLDKLYPKARGEFPEIRDEVRLAKLEAAFSDGKAEPDDARSMRAPKDASTAAPREKTVKDLEAELEAQMTKSNPFNAFGIFRPKS